MDRITYFNKVFERWNIEIDNEAATKTLKNQLNNTICQYFNGINVIYKENIIYRFYHLVGESTRCLDDPFFYDDIFSGYLDINKDSNMYYIFLNHFFYALYEFLSDDPRQEDLCVDLNEDILAASSPIQIITFEDGPMMIVPAGAKELDDALVNDVLNWLSDYPKARENLIDALKSYNSKEIKACLIHMYKSFEEFLKKFFENDKNIEKQQKDIVGFFDRIQVNPHTKNIFGQIMNFYKIYMNEYVRHGDGAVYDDIEFFLYQTGAMMRLLIQLKESQS